MAISLDGTSGITFPAGNAVPVGLSVAGTVTTTSGTTADVTGIPSTARRITVVFNGVSTSGTSLLLIQAGSGSIENTGYSSSGTYCTTASTTSGSNTTTGYVTGNNITAANTQSGVFVLASVGSNTWVCSGGMARNDGSNNFGNGVKTFSGAIDRIRVTTVNGTDTFDAGSITVLYE